MASTGNKETAGAAANTSIKAMVLRALRTPLFNPTIENILQMFTTRTHYGGLISKIPPKHVHHRSKAIRRTTVNGINYSVDLSDLVGWYAFWGFQFASRQRLYSLIHPGDTVLDIGANLGEVSLNAARMVGDAGKVFAFEPFPANFRKLQENAALNCFSNLSLINKALGSEATTLSMFSPQDGNEGMNRISSSASPGSDETSVDVITLDDFVDDEALKKIDLIKIDVEGFEMNVLKGAIKSLQKFKPKLFVEVTDEYLTEQGSSASELINFLLNQDYALTHAENGDAVTTSSKYLKTQFDVVAIPL